MVMDVREHGTTRKVLDTYAPGNLKCMVNTWTRLVKCQGRMRGVR